MSLQSIINETRELLSALSSSLGYGLGGEDEPLAHMVDRVNEGVKYHLAVMATRDKVQRFEHDEALTKLARYKAAEKWHQVTAGDGELPPAIPVLWRNNHPDFQMGELNYSIQGACGTYEWRFASSGDVP